MVKNCDLGLENAALGRFKTSVTVFHHTDQPANNIYIFLRQIVAIVYVTCEIG